MLLLLRELSARRGSAASRLGEIDIALTALNDPSGPTLRAHIWTEDKPDWMHIGDQLPVYRKNIDS